MDERPNPDFQPIIQPSGEPVVRPRSPVRQLLQRMDPAVLRLLVFFGGLIGVVTLLIAFDSIFAPLLIGLAIAYLFDPAVTWLTRKVRSRPAAVVLLTVVVALVITLFFLYLVPAIGEQAQRLEQRWPAYQERVTERFEPWLDNMESRYPGQLAVVRVRAQEMLRESWPKIANSVLTAIKGLVFNLLSFVLFLLNLIFIPVFAFYLLVDFPKIKQGFRDLLPLPYRETVLDRIREVDQAVAGFVRGQLTIALILAAINSIGLLIIGVPLGLVIGIVAGLANMIPYMALIVGLAPALFFCWVEHQSVARLVAVVAVFTGAQLLEGTVLSPRILGKSVNLHPVWVLLAVIAGGSLFGFVGMLVSVPAAAAIQVFVGHWLRMYKESRIYRPETHDLEIPGSSL